jgi:hypothetical protein
MTTGLRALGYVTCERTSVQSGHVAALDVNLDLAIVRRCVRSYRRKSREISAVFTLVTTAKRDHVGVAIQGAAESPAGSGRAITRLPALARFAPRSLVLDLADQVSTHFREGMIKVVLVGGGHEVRPSG